MPQAMSVRNNGGTRHSVYGCSSCWSWSVLFLGIVSQPHRMNEQRKVVGLHPSGCVDEVLFQTPSMKSLFSCGLFSIVCQLYSSYKEVPAIDAFH